MSAPPPVPPVRDLHATPIRCGLAPRTLGGLVALGGPGWQVALLTEGALELRPADADAWKVEGPALAWLPPGPATRLTAGPGAIGAHLTLGEAALAGAIGLRPEAADLRLLAARRCVLPLGGAPVLVAELGACFDLILREAAAGQPGATTVIEAQVRVILVLMWRRVAQPGAARHASGGGGAAAGPVPATARGASARALDRRALRRRAGRHARSAARPVRPHAGAPAPAAHPRAPGR